MHQGSQLTGKIFIRWMSAQLPSANGQPSGSVSQSNNEPCSSKQYRDHANQRVDGDRRTARDKQDYTTDNDRPNVENQIKISEHGIFPSQKANYQLRAFIRQNPTIILVASRPQFGGRRLAALPISKGILQNCSAFLCLSWRRWCAVKRLL